MLGLLYVLAMTWVWTGAFAEGGNRYLPFLAAHVTGFLLAASFVALVWERPAASIAQKVSALRLSPHLFVSPARSCQRQKPRPPIDPPSIKGGEQLLLGLSLLLIAIHWAILGRVPVVAAILSEDYNEIVMIRQSISTTGVTIAGYIPPFVIKAAIPILTIYFLRAGQIKLALLALIVGLIYAVSLMQKSYPLFVTMPFAIYALFSRRYLLSLVSGTLAVVAVTALVVVTNPSLRAGPPGIDTLVSQEQTQEDLVVSIFDENPSGDKGFAANENPGLDEELSAGDVVDRVATGLKRRVLFVPGFVVSQWFEVFPETFAFEGGCGYRFVAPLLGCEFQKNALLVYEHYFPERVAIGQVGSMNAAHFMEEYANFGIIGLALAGTLAAAALAIGAMATVHTGAVVALVLNLPFIMALSSTALHTTLLSGGWLLMLAMAQVLFKAEPAIKH